LFINFFRALLISATTQSLANQRCTWTSDDPKIFEKVSLTPFGVCESGTLAIGAEQHLPSGTLASGFGRGYAAWHAGNLVSMHLGGYGEGFYQSNHDNFRHFSEIIALQISNLAQSPFKLLLGKHKAPISYLDYQPIPIIAQTQAALIDIVPTHGGTLTISDGQTRLLDLGVHTLRPKDKTYQYHLRASQDFPGINGIRLTTTLGYAQGKVHRYGLGLLSIAPGGAKNLIEWLRKVEKGDEKPFLQRFRFVYEEPIKYATRRIFMYNDVRRAYRLGTVAQEYFLNSTLSLLGIIGYKKSEIKGQKSLWLLNFSVQAQV
jgi:hypothetical protein